MNEENLRAELAAVYASRSWRITAPMRRCMGVILKIRAVVRQPGLATGNALRQLARHPGVRRMGPRISLHFPRLYVYLVSIVNAEPEKSAVTHHVQQMIAPPRLSDTVEPEKSGFDTMSAGARNILKQFHAAQRGR